jgi:hypothetical protein
MTVYEYVHVMRSKNAGPFTLTIDLMFDNAAAYQQVLGSPNFTAEHIAELYGAPVSQVLICPFERILTIKVTMPRPGPSAGAPGDRDVYGCQQHFPLAGMNA